MDERNCALQLYATYFSADPTVQDIEPWVSFAPAVYTCDTNTHLCPKWQVNLSSSDTQNVSCGTPAPYICVNGKKSILQHVQFYMIYQMHNVKSFLNKTTIYFGHEDQFF